MGSPADSVCERLPTLAGFFVEAGDPIHFAAIQGLTRVGAESADGGRLDVSDAVAILPS